MIACDRKVLQLNFKHVTLDNRAYVYTTFLNQTYTYNVLNFGTPYVEYTYNILSALNSLNKVEIKSNQAKSNQLLFGAYFIPMTDIEATRSINQEHDPSSHANVPVCL
jgi:hypothetical protein